MGILAEGGGPGYGILAFAYGDLKIQAFRENCGFGLIAFGGVGIPFWGIVLKGRLGGTVLGLGIAFGCRTGFWGLGQRGVLRCGEIHPHAALWAGSCALNDKRGCALNDDRLRAVRLARRF